MEENRICDRAKVLLIDNDEESACFIRKMSKRGQYKVYVADSGKSGMELSTGGVPGYRAIRYSTAGYGWNGTDSMVPAME